ncbi:MAG: universal stress protein [Acetobacteraceae bacterium]|nr:universal stress protein [Acetobacteraceae bacterium]
MQMTTNGARPGSGLASDAAIRTILVTASGGPGDAPLLEAATAVAATFEAHLQVLFTRLDPQELALRIGAWDPMGASGLGSMLEDLMKDCDARQDAARQVFERICLERDVAAEWCVETGIDTDCLVAHGRTADLVLLKRGGTPEETAYVAIEAALLGCGKPLLILPASGPFSPETVAIAWKDTPEAARGIMASLPFVHRARQVLVLTVTEDPSLADDSAERVAASLSRHNPATSLVRLPAAGKEPVHHLLDEVARRGAGLLAMGGYGHSRARETVFGGFTRSILHGAPLPVLLMH